MLEEELECRWLEGETIESMLILNFSQAVEYAKRANVVYVGTNTYGTIGTVGTVGNGNMELDDAIECTFD